MSATAAPAPHGQGWEFTHCLLAVYGAVRAIRPVPIQKDQLLSVAVAALLPMLPIIGKIIALSDVMAGLVRSLI